MLNGNLFPTTLTRSAQMEARQIVLNQLVMSILTAGEMFKTYSNLYQFEEGPSEYLVDKEDFEKAMVEFAKMHVESALKYAADNAETYDYPYQDACPECGHTATYIKEESILNAYQLKNIK